MESSPQQPQARRRSRQPVLIGALLIAGTLAVFGQAATFDFVFDDGFFLSSNPHVRNGLTLAGLRWSLTAEVAGNWHPLTLWSHMLDVQLFGQKAGRHHLVNVALHCLNTLLLFGFLRRTTGATWRSAAVAALFAVHPLHVESVAWVAERKDLLSTLFLLLALGAYAGYAARPGPGRYLLVTLWFSLGLCSKPMLVTLPFVLLLLDFWPLGRLPKTAGLRQPAGGSGRPGGRRVIWEKAPLLALSAAVSVVTYRAQRDFGAMTIADREPFPLDVRALNALAAYGEYLLKTLWPAGLGVMYPHPGGALPPWKPLLSLLTIVLVTALAARFRRERPSLAVGWLWFLGTLVPVIGLVQVGEQALADRYTYVPLVGLFMIVAWNVPSPVAAGGRRAAGLAAAAGLTLAVLMVASSLQLRHWRNNLSLYSRAVAVSPGSWMMRANLGAELQSRGRLEEAIVHFRALVGLRPDIPDARHNLAFALLLAGRREEAVAGFRETLRLNPSHPRANYNLGVTLMKLGRPDEASRSNPSSRRVVDKAGFANENRPMTRDSTPRPAGSKSGWTIPILLVLLTCAAMGGVVRNGFVNYDDDLYLTANPALSVGPGIEGLQMGVHDDPRRKLAPADLDLAPDRRAALRHESRRATTR